MIYPSLLEFPAPNIWVYSAETAVAEKFEAMVQLGETNSRMKDFFDIWMLSSQRVFAGETLVKAIHATFERRGTALPSSIPIALTSDFYDLSMKKMQWKGFLRKILSPDNALSLEEVIRKIEPFLMLPVDSILTKTPMHATWLPGHGWVAKG